MQNLRAIYREKGLAGALLEDVVQRLTEDHDRWLRAMVSDELKLAGASEERPWPKGLLIGPAFMVGALIPIIPFLLAIPRPQLTAIGLTAVSAALLGAFKARYTRKSALRNALELLGIVALGTLAGVTIGAVLRTL